MTANGYGISFWGDKKYSPLGSSDATHNLVTILKTTEL